MPNRWFLRRVGVIAFQPSRAWGWRKNAARKMGGGSSSPSIASSRLSAMRDARSFRVSMPFASSTNAPIHLRIDGLSASNQRRSRRSAFSALANSLDTATAGCSSRSGSSRIRTVSPGLALAPACICLFTSRTCPSPSGPGNKEVRKAKPLISPRTLRLRHVGHALFRATGTRAITQRNRVPVGSKTARKVLLVDVDMDPQYEVRLEPPQGGEGAARLGARVFYTRVHGSLVRTASGGGGSQGRAPPF